MDGSTNTRPTSERHGNGFIQSMSRKAAIDRQRRHRTGLATMDEFPFRGQDHKLESFKADQRPCHHLLEHTKTPAKSLDPSGRIPRHQSSTSRITHTTNASKFRDAVHTSGGVPAPGPRARHAAASAPDDLIVRLVGEVTRPGGLFCKRCSALGRNGLRAGWYLPPMRLTCPSARPLGTEGGCGVAALLRLGPRAPGSGVPASAPLALPVPLRPRHAGEPGPIWA